MEEKRAESKLSSRSSSASSIKSSESNTKNKRTSSSINPLKKVFGGNKEAEKKITFRAYLVNLVEQLEVQRQVSEIDRGEAEPQEGKFLSVELKKELKN